MINKSILPFLVAIMVAILYFYATYLLKQRDKKNFDAGITQCQSVQKDNEIAQQKVVIKHRNEVIKTKDFQRKITSKPNIDGDIAKRNEWLQLIYSKRKDYNHQ